MADELSSERVLVTGVTGYVGGRLVSRLVESGLSVRVLVRGDASRIQGRPWASDVQVTVGSVSNAAELAEALDGITVAYYLVHSMRAGDDFESHDRQCAQTFAQACQRAGVRRIVYLGGLGDEADDLSGHLRSRQQVGRVLASAGVPVVELRAAVIAGSGSLSFEIIRNLAERLPVMIFPKWASTKIQPIAIADVLSYLSAAKDRPGELDGHEIIEIGGSSVESFGGMILTYAEMRGLKRYVIRVPVLTPRLSSYWVHWTTPVTADIARPLIEGARNEVVVRSDHAKQRFPDIVPIDYRTAVSRALERIDRGEIETIWSDARSHHDGKVLPKTVAEEQGLLIETNELVVDATPSSVFAAFCSFGGKRGWPFQWLWKIRGWMDQAVGGVGLRRGRRDPDHLRVGDALDFWRVEALDANRRLLLRAEMKLPGEAWLRFEAEPYAERESDVAGASAGDSLRERTLLRQCAFFAPRGLLGLLYWYAVYPLHGPVFRSMLRTIRERAAERLP